jgi:broad specificity phosphatase PhoE
MRRCLETAEAVIGGSGMEAEVRAGLREIDFGAWERRTFAEMSEIDPEGIQRWLRFDRQFSFGGGEKLGTFFSRVKREAARIAEAPGEKILVFAHGGVIRTLICHFLGLSLRSYFMLEIGPASLTAIDLFDGGKGVLSLLMPCSYLGETR